MDSYHAKKISIYAISKDKNADFSNWETFKNNDYNFKLMGDAYYEANETGKIVKDIRNE